MELREYYEFRELESDKFLVALKDVFDGRDIIEMMYCFSCGKVELIGIDSSEIVETTKKVERPIDLGPPIQIEPLPAEKEIKLSGRRPNPLVDIDEILKLIPGKSVLSDVYDKIGDPYALHKLELGVAFNYHSADKNFPHIILIDARYELVKMVAIHNDDLTFELDRLENAYGSRELAAQFDWQEHWLFETPGVGFITEERSDHNILYLQYFETRIGFNRYLELEGFSKAIFLHEN